MTENVKTRIETKAEVKAYVMSFHFAETEFTDDMFPYSKD